MLLIVYVAFELLILRLCSLPFIVSVMFPVALSFTFIVMLTFLFSLISPIEIEMDDFCLWTVKLILFSKAGYLSSPE